jgi:flagellar motility protein MotE (MotC chaperone)
MTWRDGEPAASCPIIDSAIDVLAPDVYAHGRCTRVAPAFIDELAEAMRRDYMHHAKDVIAEIEKIRKANAEIREWGDTMRRQRDDLQQQLDDLQQQLDEALERIRDLEIDR